MKKIIHIDMDAFFAQVEQRDNPDYIGKPLVVGGNPFSRGVVATCSYEARKYGIHSAMSTSQAYKRCSHAIFIKPNMKKYKEVSLKLKEIFYRYTDLVEPLSLDEAYLDVTKNKVNQKSATILANKIRKEIFNETGLTCSAGVSYNKFLAKIASDINKPNGIKVIVPEEAEKFLENLNIGDFYGIGKVGEKKLISKGIKTGADLKKWDRIDLVREFSKTGEYLYNVVRGVDLRDVNPNRVRKSVGRERTFQEDIYTDEEYDKIIQFLSKEVSKNLKKIAKKGSTITLKVKYSDFTVITKSITIYKKTDSYDTIYKQAIGLLKLLDHREKSSRLVGVSVSNLVNEDEIIQLSFNFKL